MLIVAAALLVVVAGAVTFALARTAHAGGEWRLDEAVLTARH